MLDCSYEAKQKGKARGHCLEKQSSLPHLPLSLLSMPFSCEKMLTASIHVRRPEVPQIAAVVSPIMKFWEMEANTIEEAMLDEHR